MESFAKIYKDVCLLHLKYEHLSDVCATLLQPWHNCDCSGKPIDGRSAAHQSKDTESAMPEVVTEVSRGQEKSTPSQNTSAVSSQNTDNDSKELADLRLLDSILTKAQKIRAVQTIQSDTQKSSSKRAPRNSFKSIKMATQVYQSTVVSSRTVAGKHGSNTSRRNLPLRATSRSTSIKSTTKLPSSKGNPKNKISHTPKTPQVTMEQFKQKPFVHDVEKESKLEGGGASLLNPEVVTELDINKESFGLSERVRDLSVAGRRGEQEDVLCDSLSENEVECFMIQKKGHRLSMPSRYTKLQKLLSRLNSQCGDTIRQNAGVEGADHFSKRLLSQDSISSGPEIGLLLALEEYSLLKEELLAITPQEWVVSDKTRWQDVLKVKTKVDSIIDHIQALQADLSGESLQSNSNVHPSHVHSSVEVEAIQTTHTNHTSEKLADGQPIEKLRNAYLASNSTCSFHVGLDSVQVSKSFAYMDLKEWQSLAFHEQQVLLQSWEADLIELIDKTILPLIARCRESALSSEQHSLTSSLLQTIHRLVGHKDSISYLLVE